MWKTRWWPTVGSRCAPRSWTARGGAVTIQPQVTGRITKIHFTDGADVKTGDVLFTIDPRPYQAQLDAAEANLANARAALALAKSQFARYESVTDPRAVTREDYDARKNAVEV